MDKYAELRAALDAGPTPGPWTVRYDHVVQATSFDGGRLVPVAQPYGVNSDGTDLFASARMIAACHPEAIRALLAERDALKHDVEQYVGIASEQATEISMLRATVMELVDAADGRFFGGKKDPDGTLQSVVKAARAALAQWKS